jgi:hypothetical protein
MSKKPSFSTARDQRLTKAKYELDKEEQELNTHETIRTTLSIEAPLLFAVKEIALKRKKSGTKPNTVTGIIKEALKEIIARNNP